MNMTPIEAKEIRGLSAKTLFTLIGCTVSIMATVMGSYFSIQADIKELKLLKAGEDKYNDLRIRTIEVRQSAQELQYKDVLEKLNELSTKMATIQKYHEGGK